MQAPIEKYGLSQSSQRTLGARRRRAITFITRVEDRTCPAPDDLGEGYATQVALATSEDSRLSRLTGQVLDHMAIREPARPTREVVLQERLLELCRELSGIAF